MISPCRPPSAPPPPAEPPPTVEPPAAISSRDLLAGRRELLIRHGQETYRLRLTGSNKLILTK